MVVTMTPISGTPSANLWTFSDYWSRVATYIKNDSAPTGDNLTECKRVTNDGYMMFIGEFDWSFLYPPATLSVTASAETTDLPTGYAWLQEPFCYPPDSGTGLRELEEVTWEEIRGLKAASQNATAPPTRFAVVPKTFIAGTGQQYQVIWHPVPDANYTLHYRYRVEAGAMSNDADYPLGGQAHQLTILQAAKAIAEQEKDGAPAQQWQLYRGKSPDRVGGLLAKSIRLDLQPRPRNLGPSIEQSDGKVRALYMGTWSHS